MPRRDAKPSDTDLTGREEEIALLLSMGWDCRRIGDEVGLDRRTVWDHSRKQRVQDRVRQLREERARDLQPVLVVAGRRGVEKLVELLESEDESISLRAADSLMKLVATQRLELSGGGGGPVRVSIEDQRRAAEVALDALVEAQ